MTPSVISLNKLVNGFEDIRKIIYIILMDSDNTFITDATL